ncbi:MAG: TylF/MycF/NovP-related O-methyltransferase [Mariniphaga sp.]
MNPFSKLSDKIKRSILAIRFTENQNITIELQKRALAETVDYIDQKMNGVNSYSTKNEVLSYAASQCLIPGLHLEFGVFTGQSINLISKIFKSELIFGFDSFEGLPENWRDGFPAGMFSLNKLPKVNKNVQLIKGWFTETLPKFIESNPGNIAFMHVDCDLYSSTKTIFDLLQNKICKGTVIVFDEYFNYPGWKNGEFKAFQEFANKNNIKYNYITYNNTNEQVAILIEE